MASLLKKEKRAIYARKLKGFWGEFGHHKVGLTGLALLFLFIFSAIFSPWLTPYDPEDPPSVAEGFAMPGWLGIFPQYAGYPRTMKQMIYWNIQERSEFVPNPEWGTEVVMRFVGGTMQKVKVSAGANISYPYKVSPRSFTINLQFMIEEIKNAYCSFDLRLVNTTGGQFRIYAQSPSSLNMTWSLHVTSGSSEVMKALGVDPTKAPNIAKMIFSEQGEYQLLVNISFTPISETASCTVRITDAAITIPGLLHGVLGCDNYGRDVFVQVVYGARISLAIGLLSAVIAAILGTSVGVVAGYMGGVVDEILMRIVDTMIAIPQLPILLALIMVFGPDVFLIVFLIAIFGWPGLSRVVRSHVLSLRETAFVECALASGASKRYIMIRHLVPNVFPIVISSFVLRVPGAILREAALSFLGFSDPSAPTWGRMLNLAFGHQAFLRNAWWWVVPPGLAITLICLSFVFMGHAVDEIINPRLRRRR